MRMLTKAENLKSSEKNEVAKEEIRCASFPNASPNNSPKLNPNPNLTLTTLALAQSTAILETKCHPSEIVLQEQ